MILYLDTSVLVKRYVMEAYSGALDSLWSEAEVVAVSEVGYAEAVAAFARKFRERHISRRVLNSLIRDFKADWKALLHVIVSDDVNDKCEALILKHGLRGFDAIHLASAAILKKRLKEDVLFCCADQRLLEAADKEKFHVFPANS